MQTAQDHKVRLRTETEIKALANRCRQLGGIDHCVYFNIVEYLRRCFRSPTHPKGKLLFAVVPEWHPKELPYVEYNPLTLVTTQRLLNRAETGHPFSRFQLAHETGHIIMHDHNAKAFSNDESCQISFEPKEHSAEWQANTFAKYFLLPDWLMYSARSGNQIITEAKIPIPLFDERKDDIATLSKARRTLVGFDGNDQFVLDL